MGIGKMTLDLSGEHRELRPRALLEGRRQAFLRKIDRRFEARETMEKPASPRLRQPPQRAAELPERLAALGCGLGRDEIGDAFGRGEIELAIEEGPPREFAGLGEAQPRHRRELLEQASEDRAAAMNMELGNVLAGIAARPRKEEDEPVVDDLARR